MEMASKLDQNSEMMDHCLRMAETHHEVCLLDGFEMEDQILVLTLELNDKQDTIQTVFLIPLFESLIEVMEFKSDQKHVMMEIQMIQMVVREIEVSLKQDMHEIVQPSMLLTTESSEQQVFILLLQATQQLENHNVVME